MGDKIKGITIKLGADTSEFVAAFNKLDKSLKDTQSTLKDVNKLLKLDPSNTELLAQKQKNLSKAIEGTEKQIDQLKAAQKGVKEGSEEWDKLQREIIATEQQLGSLKKQYTNFGSVAGQKIAAVGKKMQELGGKVEAVGKKLQPLSAAAGGALAAIGGVAYKAAQSADELNTLAKQTGLSTDELQRFQYASDLVDVSVDDITGALKKMKSKMSESNETFKQLGVSVTNSDGSLRDANEVFYDTLSALSQIENETERDQVAMSLFGKSADSLAGIIDDGGAALKQYGDEAEQMGLIMSSDTIDALNEVNDTIDKTKATVGASLAQFGATAAQVLAPALEKVVGIIDKVTEKLRNLSPETTETIMKVLGVVAAIAPVLIAGGKLIKGIGTVLTIVPKVIGVVSMLSPTVLIVVGVIAALIAIGVALYKNWDKIKAKAQEIVENIKEKWNNAKESVSEALNSLKEKASSIWNGIKDAAVGAVDKLKTSVTNKINAIKTTFQNFISKIKGLFNFQWSLPNIKMPHFAIDPPGWKFKDLLEGTIPKLSIQWYKRAYDNPVMFTSPTVMATPQGYKGFGDGHGAEIVMGLDKLRELVGAQANGVTINVYAQPGMNIDQLADKIQDRFVAAARQRRLLNGA